MSLLRASSGIFRCAAEKKWSFAHGSSIRSGAWLRRSLSGESALAAGGSVTNVVVGDIDKANRSCGALRHGRAGTPAAAHLPDAAADVPALSGALSAPDGGWELFALPRRDVPAQFAGHDAAAFLLLLVVALFYPKYGPDEKNNRNANTSGVVTLLEVAKTLTRAIGEVCSSSSMAARRRQELACAAHPCLKEKPVFVIDCVGGDELLVLPSKATRWDGDLLDAINEFRQRRKEDLLLKTDGQIIFRRTTGLSRTARLCAPARRSRASAASYTARESTRTLPSCAKGFTGSL